MAVDDAMSTAGLDDRVIPFAVPDLDVRGRVVRLGASIDTILDRHGYPDPVSRVLLPRADLGSDVLVDGLKEKGWEVDDVVAYRTVRAAPPPPETRDMIKTGGFDAVCFTSSSTVMNLVGIAGKPSPSTVVVAIGPATAQTAADITASADSTPGAPPIRS